MPAKHLEHRVNSEADESSPSLTPDEKNLIFTSEWSAFVIPMPERLSMEQFEKLVRATLNGHGNIDTYPVGSLGLFPENGGKK